MLVAAIVCALIGVGLLAAAVTTSTNLFAWILVVDAVIGLCFWYLDYRKKRRRKIAVKKPSDTGGQRKKPGINKTSTTTPKGETFSATGSKPTAKKSTSIAKKTIPDKKKKL